MHAPGHGDSAASKAMHCPDGPVSQGPHSWMGPWGWTTCCKGSGTLLSDKQPPLTEPGYPRAPAGKGDSLGCQVQPPAPHSLHRPTCKRPRGAGGPGLAIGAGRDIRFVKRTAKGILLGRPSEHVSEPALGSHQPHGSRRGPLLSAGRRAAQMRGRAALKPRPSAPPTRPDHGPSHGSGGPPVGQKNQTSREGRSLLLHLHDWLEGKAKTDHGPK